MVSIIPKTCENKVVRNGKILSETPTFAVFATNNTSAASAFDYETVMMLFSMSVLIQNAFL